jgi:hypothetical protein
VSAFARGAAGWLYLSGTLRRRHQHRKQLEAEVAAVELKRQREAKEFTTAPTGAKRRQ